MPKVFIDGKEFEAKARQTIIQIADGMNLGGIEQVDIPRFCYHPALPVAGNCRMCLVEMGTPKIDPATKSPVLGEDGKPVIMWVPKPITACSTEISDGMQIKTHHTSQMVKDAQKGVLEFILINHPLDCPTCDQAGECPLQQTTYKYGPEGSRYEFEKVHKPKREAWGEKITFDAERCINCTRCVRFYDEYTKSHELEIVQRGWNNYPYPPEPARLNDNAYAMNVIDLCPVGALTSTSHRFKSRVWEMSATDTISINDARCNSITIWVRDNKVMRVTSRFNPNVNGYFIPDEDRLNIQWINENRANGASIHESDAQKKVSWKNAILKATHLLRQFKPEQVAVIASAKAPLEVNYTAKKLALEILKTPNLDFIRHDQGEDDQLLIRADKTPNSEGCRLLGIAPQENGVGVDDLAEAISVGKIKCVIGIEDEMESILPLDSALKLDALILLPFNLTKLTAHASVVLPAATFAESIGAYVNFEGVIQLSKPAKALKSQNRELMKEMAMARGDRHVTQFDHWNNESNKIDARPSWEILGELIIGLGGEFNYKTAREIFASMAKKYSALNGLDYKLIGKYGIKLQSVNGSGATVSV
ncbi:MAG: 2Fe-2S iron-sulfur cluster-binding protein [Chloroherpetonaceae bacterium]|nr:2Fe-2S iron-sulfur cluster-binding protein [Chloroherpetonaceae bacterium]